jgi:DNA-binding transcriptional LysR family regulator
MMKIPRINDLQVFVAAAQSGSFTAAAAQLNMSPVVASAVIKRLEHSVGARLFERSTRSVRLSSAGARYLPHAKDVLEALARGEASVKGDAGAVGLIASPLRLSLPSDLGRNHMVRWIQDFLAAQEPSPQLELRISDRLSNLIHEQVEFAVRYGVPEDSGLIASPLAPDNRRVLCASPAYLKAHGLPNTLDDLKGHSCLRYVRGETIYSRWRFQLGDKAVVVDVHGKHIADDAAIVRQWALDGLGIAYKSYLDVAQDLAHGSLVQLMPHIIGELAPLYFYIVSKQHLSAGIRRLTEYLADRCHKLGELEAAGRR